MIIPVKRRAVLLVPLLAASRCASPPLPPATLELAVSAGADQNPDEAGRPTAVAVRLYQLAATGKFERADVFALTEREAETLGAETLASEEFVVASGESRTIARELKRDTQFVGVAVLFRDIDHATWKASASVRSNGPTRLALRTGGRKAELMPG